MIQKLDLAVNDVHLTFSLHMVYASFVEELFSSSKWLNLQCSIPMGKGKGRGAVHFSTV